MSAYKIQGCDVTEEWLKEVLEMEKGFWKAFTESCWEGYRDALRDYPKEWLKENSPEEYRIAYGDDEE